METDAIEAWLRRRQARRSLAHGGIACSLLLLSVPALILTYLGLCAAYAMTMSSLASSFGVPAGAIDHSRIASLVILVLCFPCYLRANHEDLHDLSVSTGTASNKVVHVHGDVPGVGGLHGSAVNPLAPDTARSLVKLITSLLFIAPALCLHGLNQLAKAIRVRSLGYAGAARVIRFLAAHPRRVLYGEIAQGVPAIDPTRTFPELARVDGVVVLASAPTGLSLNDELRAELAGLRSAHGHEQTKGVG